MRRKRHSAEEIVNKLREAEVDPIGRQVAVSLFGFGGLAVRGRRRPLPARPFTENRRGFCGGSLNSLFRTLFMKLARENPESVKWDRPKAFPLYDLAVLTRLE